MTVPLLYDCGRTYSDHVDDDRVWSQMTPHGVVDGLEYRTCAGCGSTLCRYVATGLPYPYELLCDLRDFANEDAARARAEDDRARLTDLAKRLDAEAKAVAPTDRPPTMLDIASVVLPYTAPVSLEALADEESGLVADDDEDGHDHWLPRICGELAARAL